MTIHHLTTSESIATVNGLGISAKEYQARYFDIHSQIQEIKGYARAFGLSESTFLQMHGLSNPAEAALEDCVRIKLMSGLAKPFSLSLDDEQVSKKLREMLPSYSLNSDGSVKKREYEMLIKQSRMTIEDFEAQKEEEIKLQLVENSLSDAAFVPSYVADKKSFLKRQKRDLHVLKISPSMFESEAGKAVTDEQLENYYKNHKDHYKTDEKRDFELWHIDAQDVMSDVVTEESALRHYYEKNKSTQFRIAPQVKVESIIIKDGDEAAQKAEEVYEALQLNADSFSSYAKTYATKEYDYFNRGTHEEAFEKAAFRLKLSNEISAPVKTERGYEILRLVDRIAAQEKSFEEVREEIEKAVKAKKALRLIQTHLEVVKRRAENYQDSLAYLKSHAHKHEMRTGITKKEENTYTLEGLLVKHGFSGKKERTGSFMHDKKHILFSVTHIEESKRKDFESVKAEIREAVMHKEAEKMMHARSTIIEQAARGQESLESLAQQYGVSHLFLRNITHESKQVEPFSTDPRLLEKVMMLHNPAHTLVYTSSSDKTTYIIKLERMQENQSQPDEEDVRLNANTHEKASQELKRAFIASLRHSAKIDINSQMMNTIRTID